MPLQNADSKSSCRGGVAFSKSAQFSQFIFAYDEFRHATIQADDKFGEYPDDRTVKSLQSREMDGHLPDELAMVD